MLSDLKMLIAVMAGWIQRLSSYESWLGDKVGCLFPSALFSSVVTCYHHLSARLSHSFQLGSSEMWLEISKKASTKHGRFELPTYCSGETEISSHFVVLPKQMPEAYSCIYNRQRPNLPFIKVNGPSLSHGHPLCL